MPLGLFQFFRKLAEIIANECSSAVSTTPAKTSVFVLVSTKNGPINSGNKRHFKYQMFFFLNSPEASRKEAVKFATSSNIIRHLSLVLSNL